MNSMEPMFDEFIPISKVSPQIICELKNGAYKHLPFLYNENCLDILSRRGKKYTVTVFCSKDKEIWSVYDWTRKKWSNKMTKELKQAFRAERAK